MTSARRRTPSFVAHVTSDVKRPRAALLAAIAAAFAVALAAWLAPSSIAAEAAPGALSASHAKLACAECHAKGSPAVACAACHGPHRSARAGHRALATRGELPCTRCHAGHGGDQQGVRLEADAVVRWGGDGESRRVADARAPAGSTIALLPIARCAGCHDPRAARDPIRRCAPDPAAAHALSTCFDEHDSASPAGSRFVAWEAARDAVRAVPWVRARERRASPWAWLGAGAAAGTIALAALGAARRRSTPAIAAPVAPPDRVRLPIIDTATCVGCGACVDACAFDVLEMKSFVAVVARPLACCGATTCEAACPNGSLRMDRGAPIATRPRVDDHLESLDAPGVFVAGDLTGLPLIKNAIAQGARTVDRIAQREPSVRGVDADVVVVGAGPAGLAAALRAKEHGLSCIVLEQGSVASTIRAFPRDKLVFDAPLELPVHGALWMRESTKEELLAQWTRVVRMQRLDVRERHRVVGVERQDGAIVVSAHAPDGERRVRAARLVLAIGRRGSPRALDAEIEPGAESMVSYAIADARSFAGKRVVVVGLGDSAMETAIALARQPATRVTISYRGGDFGRGSARNVAELARLVASDRVRVVWSSRVARVGVRGVDLELASSRERIACDAVVVQIGGVTSWDLLAAAGVRIGADVRADVDPAATESRD